MNAILLIDDEPEVLKGESTFLRLHGFDHVRATASGRQARSILETEEIALVLLDLTLKDESGIDLLRFLRDTYPATVVVVVTGTTELSTAVECMRLGAYDYLLKGSDNNRMIATIRNALEHRRTLQENRLLREAFTRTTPAQREAFQDFISVSPVIQRLLVYAETVAPLPDPILIHGETGVGKELVARGIHRASGRTGAFVPLNLGGLDDLAFSDTLFGHRRGAYTGADTPRDGLVRSAAEGTLFLDEIGEMPIDSQTRLLRLLDDGEFRQLGSDTVERCKARLICATNRDLPEAVQAGTFRKDLYFRIATHQVRIPSLRERPEDISPIISHIMQREADRLGYPAVVPPDSTVHALRLLPLEGNVRELRQLVLKTILQGSWSWTHSTDREQERQGTEGNSLQPVPDLQRVVYFGKTLPTPYTVVSELLKEADRRYPHNRSEAAAAIGLSPQAFANRWKRLTEG
jgi:DNA-binding NtrC family response regulator